MESYETSLNVSNASLQELSEELYASDTEVEPSNVNDLINDQEQMLKDSLPTHYSFSVLYRNKSSVSLPEDYYLHELHTINTVAFLLSYYQKRHQCEIHKLSRLADNTWRLKTDFLSQPIPLSTSSPHGFNLCPPLLLTNSHDLVDNHSSFNLVETIQQLKDAAQDSTIAHPLVALIADPLVNTLLNIIKAHSSKLKYEKIILPLLFWRESFYPVGCLVTLKLIYQSPPSNEKDEPVDPQIQPQKSELTYLIQPMFMIAQGDIDPVTGEAINNTLNKLCKLLNDYLIDCIFPIEVVAESIASTKVKFMLHFNRSFNAPPRLLLAQLCIDTIQASVDHSKEVQLLKENADYLYAIQGAVLKYWIVAHNRYPHLADDHDPYWKQLTEAAHRLLHHSAFAKNFNPVEEIKEASLLSSALLKYKVGTLHFDDTLVKTINDLSEPDYLELFSILKEATKVKGHGWHTLKINQQLIRFDNKADKFFELCFPSLLKEKTELLAENNVNVRNLTIEGATFNFPFIIYRNYYLNKLTTFINSFTYLQILQIKGNFINCNPNEKNNYQIQKKLMEAKKIHEALSNSIANCLYLQILETDINPSLASLEELATNKNKRKIKLLTQLSLYGSLTDYWSAKGLDAINTVIEEGANLFFEGYGHKTLSWPWSLRLIKLAREKLVKRLTINNYPYLLGDVNEELMLNTHTFFTYLGKALTTGWPLDHLSLSNNQLPQIGIHCLISYLPYNLSLASLNLDFQHDSNPWSNCLLERIVDRAALHPFLTNLSLAGANWRLPSHDSLLKTIIALNNGTHPHLEARGEKRLHIELRLPEERGKEPPIALATFFQEKTTLTLIQNYTKICHEYDKYHAAMAEPALQPIIDYLEILSAKNDPENSTPQFWPTVKEISLKVGALLLCYGGTFALTAFLTHLTVSTGGLIIPCIPLFILTVLLFTNDVFKDVFKKALVYLLGEKVIDILNHLFSKLPFNQDNTALLAGKAEHTITNLFKETLLQYAKPNLNSPSPMDNLHDQEKLLYQLQNNFEKQDFSHSFFKFSEPEENFSPGSSEEKIEIEENIEVNDNDKINLLMLLLEGGDYLGLQSLLGESLYNVLMQGDSEIFNWERDLVATEIDEVIYLRWWWLKQKMTADKMAHPAWVIWLESPKTNLIHLWAEPVEENISFKEKLLKFIEKLCFSMLKYEKNLVSEEYTACCPLQAYSIFNLHKAENQYILPYQWVGVTRCLSYLLISSGWCILEAIEKEPNDSQAKRAMQKFKEFWDELSNLSIEKPEEFIKEENETKEKNELEKGILFGESFLRRYSSLRDLLDELLSSLASLIVLKINQLPQNLNNSRSCIKKALETRSEKAPENLNMRDWFLKYLRYKQLQKKGDTITYQRSYQRGFYLEKQHEVFLIEFSDIPVNSNETLEKINCLSNLFLSKYKKLKAQQETYHWQLHTWFTPICKAKNVSVPNENNNDNSSNKQSHNNFNPE